MASLPLRVTLIWLGGTFLLFLVVGKVAEVHNLTKLASFIAATMAAFAVGFHAKSRQLGPFRREPTPMPTPDDAARIRRLASLSAIYFAAYGLAMLSAYGLASPAAILQALTHPGDAYLAKFDVYASQQALGTQSAPIQILTLGAVFSAPLVPFLIVHRRQLTIGVRLLAIAGIGLYALYFLAIGTLSGLGNLLIVAIVAGLVARARSPHTDRGHHRRMNALAAIGVLAFVSYMAYAQAGRIDSIGNERMYAPNPIVRGIVGDDLARGITVVSLYPTHGYQGLAYNLDTPFEWTYGRGSSRAVDSYLDQYGFGKTIYDRTYPRRTEVRTGWPAGQYWATIYPWLASDLTYPGAIGFMSVVGWWMARFWREATVEGNTLSLLLLCQLGLLVAFVPANNQLGIGRPTVIAFLSLAVLYGAQMFRDRRSAMHRPWVSGV